MTAFLFIPIPFLESVGQDVSKFPHDKFAQYLGGLLALFSMLFLGFADDILDIPWRIKIWFPLIASIPLLLVYFVTYGRTDVLLPLPMRFLFSSSILHLGPLYYVYLAMLVTFCTNSINILAGVNGVEGGQSLVIALSIALNDLLQMNLNPSKLDAHLNSLYILIPFIAVTSGYLKYNWFPAKVFGGDTYCYFAGMVFAVVGILGNFSKTVLLFMVPQIFNFVFSCPQLFHIIPCPRHRMPSLKENGLIESSRFILTKKDNLSFLSRLILSLCHTLGLIDIQIEENGDQHVSNFTLISLILIKCGPMTEENTALAVLLVQSFCSLIAFGIRYGLVLYLYP